MRKVQKKQIEETIALMGKVHEEIRKQLADGNRVNARQLLSDAQEGAIQIGNLIEQLEGEDAPSIRLIEEYCETCYRLYVELETEKKQNPSGVYRLLKKMLAEVGENCYIEPPFYSNWGGSHVHFGDNVYANFHLTAVDDGHIYVGNNVMIAPNVTLATAAHPIDPELRRETFQYNADVHIGDNVWLGAGVVVLPGVTIGENSVIGAGSVVTRDIPPFAVACGSPARVVKIQEH